MIKATIIFIIKLIQLLILIFKQCSIMMSTSQLAQSMQYIANHGVNPLTNERLISISKKQKEQVL